MYGYIQSYIHASHCTYIFHIYKYTYIHLSIYILLYACIYMHLGVFWLAFASHPTCLLPLVRRVTHDFKEAMQNYQMQAQDWLDITAPSISILSWKPKQYKSRERLPIDGKKQKSFINSAKEYLMFYYLVPLFFKKKCDLKKSKRFYTCYI